MSAIPALTRVPSLMTTPSSLRVALRSLVNRRLFLLPLPEMSRRLLQANHPGMPVLPLTHPEDLLLLHLTENQLTLMTLVRSTIHSITQPLSTAYPHLPHFHTAAQRRRLPSHHSKRLRRNMMICMMLPRRQTRGLRSRMRSGSRWHHHFPKARLRCCHHHPQLEASVHQWIF